MERVWTVKRPAISRSAKARQNELFQEAVRNVGSFVIPHKIFFKARKIEVLSPEKMAVIVPRRKGKIEGFSLVSQNISDPKLLDITIQRCILKQNPGKPSNFLIQGDGMISIGVEKNIDPPGQPKSNSRRMMPIKGPDLTSVDGMEFLKTGTFQVMIKLAALVILS